MSNYKDHMVNYKLQNQDQMFKQQEHIEAQIVVIPFQRISKFYHFLGFGRKQYKFLQYRECIGVKPKTVYGAYSAQSLIKLFRAMQINQSQFLQTMAITTTLSKRNKKQFVIDKILRQYSFFSFGDILRQLHYIRQQLKSKQLYRQMLDFIKIILSKAKYLLYKHRETLVMVLGQCLNFYIRRRQMQDGQMEYSLILGMDNICISFCSSNQFCENILHGFLVNLTQHLIKDGFDIDDKEFQSINIQSTSQNIFRANQIPQYLAQVYERKQNQVQERANALENVQIIYTNLVFNLLIKFAQDIFYLIQSTIVFLSNLVLQKKQIKNISYDEQYISMKHPLKQQKIGQTFMNLYCQHFQGLPQQLYRNELKCPYCSQIIIIDEIKCFQRNRNVFQNSLSQNYLNPLGENVIYYFKERVFYLANKQKFSNYPHFCQFIKKYNHIRDRPQVLMLLESEKVSLYGKIWGKKKLFICDQLIQTPVRGKYCRHLQFFQLMRVYQEYIKRQAGQTSFDCFLCLQPIQYTQLMYLHEIKLLIDLARHNFYSNQQSVLNSYLQIDHNNETVELCSQLEKGYMKRAYKLPIYNTLIDPLTKSQKLSPQDKTKKSEQEEEGDFQYTEEFRNFFFGY